MFSVSIEAKRFATVEIISSGKKTASRSEKLVAGPGFRVIFESGPRLDKENDPGNESDLRRVRISPDEGRIETQGSMEVMRRRQGVNGNLAFKDTRLEEMVLLEGGSPLDTLDQEPNRDGFNRPNSVIDELSVKPGEQLIFRWSVNTRESVLLQVDYFRG